VKDAGAAAAAGSPPSSLSFCRCFTPQLCVRAMFTSVVVSWSRKKAVSSSKLFNVFLAFVSFVDNSSTASSSLYSSMTFAPSQRQTTSTGGAEALAQMFSLIW